jgi:hypothetical protein
MFTLAMRIGYTSAGTARRKSRQNAANAPTRSAGCDDGWVAVSRADRRRDREPRVRAVFSEEQVAPALDLLEWLELAWHDCYDDITPSDEIVADVLLLSEGSIDLLIHAARLAVTDWRDLKVNAAKLRGTTP